MLKIQTDSIALQASDISLQNSAKQLARMETMYDQGVKSLTDLENMRLKYQQSLAKQNGIKNKLLEYANDQINLNQEVKIAQADFEQKRAKIEADIQTADSYRFSLIGDSDKLQSKLNQLSQRALAYAITSPIRGTVTKVLKNGIGEFVKAQESISTIVPAELPTRSRILCRTNGLAFVGDWPRG